MPSAVGSKPRFHEIIGGKATQESQGFQSWKRRNKGWQNG